jgi:multidrug resistance efflux pump
MERHVAVSRVAVSRGMAVESRSGLAGWVPTRSVMAVKARFGSTGLGQLGHGMSVKAR